MNKYIVKNCPSISTINLNNPLCYECDNSVCGEPWRCMDRDCLIKQVIEKCKEDKGCPCPKVGSSCYECPTGAEWDFSNILLQLFEIEEVE